MMIDAIACHNRAAWDREVAHGNPATVPVTADQITAARAGSLILTLSGSRPIPPGWIAGISGSDVICLACGGGQQVPLLAAAGAKVTSLENSPRQLDRDREAIDLYGLSFRPVLGDMRDLRMFKSESFDFVFVGLGTQFVPDPSPVWHEAGGVLRRGGCLIAAIVNPVTYTLDWIDYKKGIMRVAHALPYSDLLSLTDDERRERFDTQDPLEFGHSLETQIGAITASGMCIDGFFDDVARDELSANFFATYHVFRARKEECRGT